MNLLATRLIEPELRFEKSYCDYLAELGQTRRIPFPLNYPHKPFHKLVQKLRDQSLGIGLNEGFVPNSTFWLVEDCEILGVANLRHFLNSPLEAYGGHIGYGIRSSVRGKGYGKEILRITLLEAAKRGINEVLLHCSSKNIPSIKVIEANGGQFESEWYNQCARDVIRQYQILF